MTRVYIDSNVYRYLKTNSDYSELLDKLNNLKDRLIFYFSYAHLSDLTKDKTEKKFEDLAFMEQLVDQNYLNLQTDQQTVNVQIASPTDAFNNLDHTPMAEAINFTELFKELEITSEDTPELIDAKEKMKVLLNMPLGLPNFTEELEESNPLKRMVPSFGNGTLLDLMKGMLSTFDNLYQDPTVWRDFRTYSIDSLNLKKFDIDVTKDGFSDKLKDTPLQKSFLEFVEDIFTTNKSLEKQREYNFFINAYSCLNLLGLDNEKSKKVVFSSFQSDAQHAYYAAHCEYLISDDEQLLIKAKVLYNLFGIDTKVLSLQELEQQCDAIAGKPENDPEAFFKNIVDIFDENTTLIDVENYPEENKKEIVYHLKRKYFNFFNRLNLIIENEDKALFIFFNHISNYSKFTSFKEFEAVTNKIVKLLGTDGFGKGNFTDDDANEIVDNNWKGRSWHTPNESFHLQVAPQDYRLYFYYLPNIKLSKEDDIS